jgi:hypothetical protein
MMDNTINSAPSVDLKSRPETEAVNQLGILARRRIEAEIIKPIYEILKREIGTERAQAIIGEAVNNAAVAAGQNFASREPNGVSMASFVATLPQWEQDDALKVKVISADDSHFDFDVQRCRYSEMYRDLGMSEIGHLLSCARDYTFIEGYDPRVKLNRTTTIMQGHSHCDFRYEMCKEATSTDKS